jgi:hypothetical protein
MTTFMGCLRRSWGARAQALCVVALVAGGGGCKGSSGGDNHVFKGGAARTGKVVGQVIDADTGNPIVEAQVLVGGQTVRVRPDGTFEAEAAAGRVAVRVRGDGFLDTAREVPVGPEAFSMPFKLARKEPAQPVGQAGGTLRFREAQLQVPAGAFSDGSSVSLTYLSRIRVASISASPQFVDADSVPRRAVATATLESSAMPSAAVRVRIPVPMDATPDSVRGYLIDDEGKWSTTMTPQTVAGGMAEFSVSGGARFGVALDARHADGSHVGYVVVEGGDSPMMTGDVVASASDIVAISQPLALVDPQGSRIEVAPASRMRVEVPAQPDSAATRAPVAAYAGNATLSSGRMRVVVAAPAGADASAPVRLSVRGQAATFSARGGAFALSTCSGGGGAVDVLEVGEGTVDATFQDKVSSLAAGESATFCPGCSGDQAPSCSAAAADGGAPDAPPTMMTCEPTAPQSCGSGKTCAFRCGSGGAAAPVCAAAGARHEGDACQRDQDCAPGTQCFTSSCGAGVCLAVCKADGDCKGSGHCGSHIQCSGGVTSSYGTCTLPCDPTGAATTGCPAGLACFIGAGEVPDCGCKAATQVGGEGLPCSSAGECRPGLLCVDTGGGRVCRPLCRLDTHVCATGTCTKLVDPDFSTFGACLP